MTRNIEEAFREHLITEATGFEPGVAVSESLAQNSLNMLEEGESKGATFLLGGAGFSKSASLRPTILSGITKDMAVLTKKLSDPLSPFTSPRMTSTRSSWPTIQRTA